MHVKCYVSSDDRRFLKLEIPVCPANRQSGWSLPPIWVPSWFPNWTKSQQQCEEEQAEECKEEIRICSELCADAQIDPDREHVYGGSITQCLKNCLSEECGGEPKWKGNKSRQGR